MIRLIGEASGSEFEAARDIKESIAASWPAAADPNNKLDEITIVVGGRVFGGAVQDIDVAIIISLSRPVKVKSLTRIRADDAPYEFPVQHACILIEVKGHSGNSVRFRGGSVEVLYRNGWHDATNQCAGQVRALRALVENMGARPPLTHDIIWLRNAAPSELPSFLTNIMAGRSIEWRDILDQCDEVHPGYFARMATHEAAGQFRYIFDALARTREITPMDRRRMDSVINETLPTGLLGRLGTELIILRGPAGSGKTATLLRIAHHAFREQSARVLILTYNRALVADLRRQLDLLGVPAAVQGSGIRIETAHSFFSKWTRSEDFGIALGSEGVEFSSETYSKFLDELLTYLKQGLITHEDVRKAKLGDRGPELDWSMVLVDEGQDWPIVERDLLFELYGPSHVLVGDGQDQLVRDYPVCDWSVGLNPKQYHVEPMPLCKRMQTGLVDFCNAIASRMHVLDWRLRPFTDVAGGRVIVVEGDYFADRFFHDSLKASNMATGNKGIDMLFCVPPSLVVGTNHQNRESIVGQRFKVWNEKVWNGVSDLERIRFPLDIEELRVVQYDSCRGLEGWVVVNFAFEDFFEYKYVTWRPTIDSGMPIDEEAERMKFAASWAMIPLTRALDTLVINVSREPTPLKALLKEVYAELPGVVEWVTV